MMFSTNPSSKLTTNRCLVAIVMTIKDECVVEERKCLTCCPGGIALFPLPVIAVNSIYNLLHVCIAPLKSLRWFTGPWIPSAIKEGFHYFSFRLVSCRVATYKWSSNAISSYWMICSSVHPKSDKDLRYLSSLCHLSRVVAQPPLFELVGFP